MSKYEELLKEIHPDVIKKQYIFPIQNAKKEFLTNLKNIELSNFIEFEAMCINFHNNLWSAITGIEIYHPNTPVVIRKYFDSTPEGFIGASHDALRKKDILPILNVIEKQFLFERIKDFFLKTYHDHNLFHNFDLRLEVTEEFMNQQKKYIPDSMKLDPPCVVQFDVEILLTKYVFRIGELTSLFEGFNYKQINVFYIMQQGTSPF